MITVSERNVGVAEANLVVHWQWNIAWLVKRGFRHVDYDVIGLLARLLSRSLSTPTLKLQADPYSKPSITEIRVSSVSSAPPHLSER